MNNNNQEDIFTHLKVFVEFICEEKVYSIDDVINASISLLKNCPASRYAVFKFYNQLFTEYCYEYCVANSNNVEAKLEKPEVSVVLLRFVKALNANNVNEMKDTKTTDNSNDKTEIKSIDDCPQSPSKEICEDYEMEDLSLSNNSLQKENDLSTILILLDKHMNKLGVILNYLLANDTDVIFTISIFDWALDLATEMSLKYQRFVAINTSESNHSKISKSENLYLMNSLGFWTQCSAMQVLTKIIFDSVGKTEEASLISRILKYSPHSDWILAHLFTNISQSVYLTNYIEQLSNNTSSYSMIFILSYVSEHNPNAIVNCSKSNIPFLLKLCTNSKPLLDLLSNDIVKKVNVKALNKLAELYSEDEVNENILYCFLNAPNAFELLEIAFDLVVCPDTSEVLGNRILNMLSLVTLQIHNFVYGPPDSNISESTYPIVVLLRNNIQQLISNRSISKNTSLKKIQLRLLNLICIYYGTEFITEVFHHLMNVSIYSINTSNYENPKLNPLLLPLFNSLRLYFGYEIQNCFQDTLKLPYIKNLSFWAYLMILVESIKINVDDLVNFLKQKSFDQYENVYTKFFILKSLTKIFENNQKMYYREQYKLCFSLVNVYFELIQLMQDINEQHLVVIVNCIVTLQKFLSHLANNFDLNEYIICRTLLDFIKRKRELFLPKYCEQNFSVVNYRYTSLLNENMDKSDNNFKLKKNPLLPYYKKTKKQDILTNDYVIWNKQLLIDLLQSCIKNKVLFAKTFVNSLSNELLLNDAPWLEEDPKDGQIQHLRMTFEKDLYICRLFEDNPILWNIFEIISKGQYLKHCLVIIRALINVQRANLASSTLNNKNILLTQKVITLISNNEILPLKPFQYIRELVPKIKHWEMCYVLHDIVRYIRDNNTSISTNAACKPYLERLRIIMAHHQPNEIYIKIFKCL